MKISVIMIDGGFRENTFSAEYFTKQDFPEDEFEVIWVDYFSKVPAEVLQNKKIKVITLSNLPAAIYHSSYCFNKGIEESIGELLVIPDADQIVEPDFLTKLWELHQAFDKLVIYPYRYDEISHGTLNSFKFDELRDKCVLKNPVNYGGCLTVRKKWLLKINGYEQHRVFESGFHANGLDIYTRFKNLGLAILWAPELKMYHPWHPSTLRFAKQYQEQFALIEWRKMNLQYLAISGLDPSLDTEFPNLPQVQKPKENSNRTGGLLRRLKKYIASYV